MERLIMRRTALKKRKTNIVIFVTVIIITMLTACSKPVEPTGSKSPTTNENAKSSTKEPTTVEEITLYEGPDREQRLIEAAKKEGTFNVYTALPLDDMQKITDGFKKKYGITANIWRANAVEVTQRITTEAQSGKSKFDVVTMSSLQNEILSREKLLQKVNSPFHKKIMKEAIPTHKEWTPLYYNLFVQAYNTKAVKKEELPKTYQDFLNPKWKDRLGYEVSSNFWFYGVVKQMGEEKGLQYFKDLMKTNDVSIRNGYSKLAELVGTGEVPYALTVLKQKATQMKDQGAPIDWYVIEPAITIFHSVAISKKASNPNSALLFFDYMLSDGQKMLADMYYDPVNEDFQPKEKINMYIINDQTFLDEYQKWFKLNEDFVKMRTK